VRSQRVRRDATHQFSFDQHSRLRVAIGRLSHWPCALVRIDALERLDAAEAGSAERSSADGAGRPTDKRLRADANERPGGRINAFERRLDGSEAGLGASR
jgi:hypothetical protein